MARTGEARQDEPVCRFCGHALELDVQRDDSLYQRSIQILGRADVRFQGETYRYVCRCCNRAGMVAHRYDCPDMTGHVETRSEARFVALLLYYDNPDENCSNLPKNSGFGG